MEFYTIGVYNSDEQEFFEKLKSSNIDTFCDIRQRRGVRGAKYAFVNSIRLQNRLKEMGINYSHTIDLAPTKEIRELQKQADLEQGNQKRTRDRLGEVFTIGYNDKILQQFDLSSFIENLKKTKAEKVVLFCVEEKHEACHRSLVTKKLEKSSFNITHL